MSSPYDRIIVGTDGSDTATRALHAAVALAAGLDLPLTIAAAWRRDRDDDPPRSEQASYPGSASGMESSWAASVTSDAASIAREAGIDDDRIEQASPGGEPRDAMLELGGEHPDALVVVGTVGLDRRAERVLGNLPHHLTHHSDNDLLLVAEHDQASWGSVALATDGSETAAHAVRCGADLARALGAESTLLTVASSQEDGEKLLDEAARDLDVEPDGRQVVVDDDVTDALVDAAQGYDLLVIGNKRMRGASRWLGSIANRVTHEVPTDILLVNTTR